MINIGFIGYKNHSFKIIKLLEEIKEKKYFFFFHPSKKIKKLDIQSNHAFTNNIELLNSCDCIFITSPNETHVKYIKKFYKKKYIFCEKPPAINMREYNFLKNIPNYYKKKILFNFHLLNTPMFLKIANLLKNKKKGLLQNVSISVSHGAMLKKKLLNKRFKNYNNFSNILGNLGIHYLRLIVELNSKIKILSVNLKSFNKKKIVDTANMSMLDNKHVNYSIFLSYSSPLTNFIKMVFTNLVIVFDNGLLYLYRPRDSFDKNGSFCKAKIIKIFKYKSAMEHNSLGLKKRIRYFLKNVINKSFFDVGDFDKSIKTVKLNIDAFKKIN